MVRRRSSRTRRPGRTRVTCDWTAKRGEVSFTSPAKGTTYRKTRKQSDIADAIAWCGPGRAALGGFKPPDLSHGRSAGRIPRIPLQRLISLADGDDRHEVHVLTSAQRR